MMMILKRVIIVMLARLPPWSSRPATCPWSRPARSSGEKCQNHHLAPQSSRRCLAHCWRSSSSSPSSSPQGWKRVPLEARDLQGRERHVQVRSAIEKPTCGGEVRLFPMIANTLCNAKLNYSWWSQTFCGLWSSIMMMMMMMMMIANILDCEVRLFLMILNILWIIQPVHGDELVRLVEVKEEDVRTLNRITMIFFEIWW